ncbi:hypothetical protein SAMN02745975_03899 [Geosporobacter subterraneus DSM 17957]|uniref:Uncharacterized protein n=1 Tax=Geosporobacter subterraneus DSM 17957 TaxID=1121919 RepID=A0A1M6QPT2_9FIRM|nr:hypothetical protein [Geosporobacter subterraneus]SHK22299.1 hypothetical protein SAMN02745975_03899 [Geosporobacter subterraneus DSM 17957]
MYKKLMSKKFFEDNPYMENSVQRFIYSTLLYEELEDLANEITIKQGLLSDERLEHITREKELIQSEQNPEEIFQLLRKKTEMINRRLLVKKALAFEEVILPMVVDKLMRSYHDIFIENSIELLAKSNKNYSSLLMEKYTEIRSPYVQSLVCLILGFRGEEKIIPWMVDRFYEMKKLYPDESYDQGPLLALHELNSRFYGK